MVDNAIQNVQYSGFLRPQIPEFKSPPDWIINTKFQAGDNPKYWGALKVYLQKPTIQFPTAVCKIVLQNSSKSTYQTINPIDLATIIQSIQDKLPEINEKWAKYKAEEEALKKQLFTVHEQMEQFKILQKAVAEESEGNNDGN